MSSQLLEQAFGGTKNSINEINLYKDVLHVNKDCTKAQLRKAYYKQALKYHPDKNDTEEAKIKFQAISWVYNLLKDPIKRSDYDNDGIIPFDDEVDSDDDDETKPKNSWKNYFDLIFGKLSTSDIDNFAMKYKMSDEEEKDVLDNYIKFKGNLMKMLEYVMLSEERDVPRWCEDYIQPAIDSGKISNIYTKKMNTTLQKIKKKLEKEQQEEEEEEEEEDDEEMEVEAEVDDDEDEDEDEKEEEEEEEDDHQQKERDDDETETEESSGGDEEEEVSNKKKKKKKKPVSATNKAAKKKSAGGGGGAAVATNKAPPPKKGKPTKAKKKKETSSSSQADLIAAIRNKSGRGNPLASIAARYGVSMDSDDDNDNDDNDPLNDAEFEKIQAKLNKNKKRRKK